MDKRDMRKQSIYVPVDMLMELQALSKRTDRSVSWLLQRAWKLATEQLQKLENAP